MNIIKIIIFFLGIKELLIEKREKIKYNFISKVKILYLNLGQELEYIFNSKKLVIFGSISIIAASIFVSFSRDIGLYSALIIDLTNLLAVDSKSFYDFAKNSSPLIFYINLIPHFASKILNIDIVVSYIIFGKIIGAISIYIAVIILQRTNIYLNIPYYNIVILSFSCGYFLRIFNLNLNEFNNESNYFLALFFPYICYQLIDKKNIVKRDEIIMGALSFIMMAININYIFLIVGCEIVRAISGKSILRLFDLHNILAIFLIILYQSLVINNFNIEISSKFYLYNFKHHFALLSLIYLIFYKEISKDKILRFFITLSIISFIALLGDNPAKFDQISIFYSLSFSAIFLILYYFIKSQQGRFIKNWFFIVVLIMLPIISQQHYHDIIINLPNLWWFFAFFIAFKYKKYRANILTSKISAIILPVRRNEWLLFFLNLTILLYLSYHHILYVIVWIINIYFFYFLIICDKGYDLQLKKNKSSKIYILVIVAIFSQIFGLIAQGFTVNNNDNLATKLKSPNFVNDQIMRNIKSYTKEDRVVIIGDKIYDRYPIIKYLSEQQNLKEISYNVLYDRIAGKKDYNDKIEENQLSNLIAAIANKNEMIIVKNYDDNYRRNCQISFLEFYLRNKTFRDIFIKNYKFVNRVTDYQKQDPKITINKKSELQEKLDQNGFMTIIKDYEIYIKK